MNTTCTIIKENFPQRPLDKSVTCTSRNLQGGET